MSIITITDRLKGDLGELLFEHFCVQNRFAYIKLETIYNTLTPKNQLVFCYDRHRIAVTIPSDIAEEIRSFSVPLNKINHKPYFVFDYLTVLLDVFTLDNDEYKQKPSLKGRHFHWIEVKTGKSKLSSHQENYAAKAEIDVRLFRIDLGIVENYKITNNKINKRGGSTSTLREHIAHYGIPSNTETVNAFTADDDEVFIIIENEQDEFSDDIYSESTDES